MDPGVDGAVLVVMLSSSKTKREEGNIKAGRTPVVAVRVVVAAATGVDNPHVGGVASVRGARPPLGGAAVELRDSLVVGR